MTSQRIDSTSQRTDSTPASAKLLLDLIDICARLETVLVPSSGQGGTWQNIINKVCNDRDARVVLLALPNLTTALPFRYVEKLLYDAPPEVLREHWMRMTPEYRIGLLRRWDSGQPKMSLDMMTVDEQVAKICALRAMRDCRIDIRAIFQHCSPYWLCRDEDDRDFNAPHPACAVGFVCDCHRGSALLAHRTRHARAVVSVLLLATRARKEARCGAALLVDVPHLSCYIAHLIMGVGESPP